MGLLGKLLFWLGWPVSYLFGRGRRTRVLVMSDNRILLVKDLISADDAWGLPGGGIWSATDTSLFDTALVHNGIFKAVMSGTDTLLYTVSNYCGSVTDSLPVHIFTKAQCDSVNGISEFADRDTDGFSIFPNPSNGTLHIAVNTANGQPFNIAILNTLGQKVWAQTYNAAKNSSSFVVELEDHLKSGFYYIVLTNNEIRNTKSFMLQR